MVTHHRAMERHLPYGITQSYLLPNTPHQPSKPVLDLPTSQRQKAELTLVVGYIPRWFTCPQTADRPIPAVTTA